MGGQRLGKRGLMLTVELVLQPASILEHCALSKGPGKDQMKGDEPKEPADVSCKSLPREDVRSRGEARCRLDRQWVQAEASIAVACKDERIEDGREDEEKEKWDVGSKELVFLCVIMRRWMFSC
jgi:hypothetical protein